MNAEKLGALSVYEELGKDGGRQINDLVQAAANGEEDAIRSLVEMHQKEVLRFCLRYTKDPDEAEDLAQQTFIKALNSLKKLKNPASFKPWLFRIAGNLALNRMKAKKKEQRLGDLDQASDSKDPRSVVLARERELGMMQALANLPEKQRRVVELRGLAELPFKEVAAILDITENSAKVNYHIAIKKLAGLLSGYERPEREGGHGE